MKNKSVIDKSMILNFANDLDENDMSNLVYSITDTVDDITMELATQNKFLGLGNIDLVLAGDFATKTNILDSNLDFYLTVKSSQIELNTIKDFSSKKKRFLNRLKLAWANVKSKKKRRFFRRRKQKKQVDVITEQQLIENGQKPYTISDVKNDYFNKLASKFTNLTVIYNSINKITILAKEELGYKINIYPVLVHDDEYRLWDSTKNKFKYIFLNDAISLIEEKNSQINYSQNLTNQDSKLLKFNNKENLFLKAIKVFKNLAQIVLQTENLTFVDSLIYNCPNEIFADNVYETTIRLLNYLKNAHIADFYSVYNINTTMFEQHNMSIMQIKNLINEISNLITNE